MNRTMPALARATPTAYPQGAAACVGADVDPDVFFPPGQSDRLEQEAVQVCQACPLREACLDYALAWDVRGIWGGTTYRQRERIRTARGVAALPVLVGWIVDRSAQPGPKPAVKAAPLPDLDLSLEGDPMPSTLPTPIDRARRDAGVPEARDVESVDDLLAAARALDDRKVGAAVDKATSAISKLRDAYGEAARRIADEQAAQEAKTEALAEIERLKAQLAEAEARAAEVGAKVRKPPPRQAGGVASQARAWARENGIDVPAVGRVPRGVLEKYEAAQRAVAS